MDKPPAETLIRYVFGACMSRVFLYILCVCTCPKTHSNNLTYFAICCHVCVHLVCVSFFLCLCVFVILVNLVVCLVRHRALEQLYALGALNDRGELTKLGRRMAEFPLDPMMSKSLIAAEKYQCVDEVLTITAMISLGSSVFYRPKDKAVHADNAKLNFARGGGGDHLALMRCYKEWVDTSYSTQWCYENYVQVRNLNKARDIREQLAALCERVEIEVSSSSDTAAIGKALTAGYFYNISKLGKSGTDYKTVKHKHTVYIHPSSVMSREEDPPKWLLYHELAYTTKEYMRTVTPISGEWLIEIAPHYYQQTDVEEEGAKKMPKQTGLASNSRAP